MLKVSRLLLRVNVVGSLLVVVVGIFWFVAHWLLLLCYPVLSLLAGGCNLIFAVSAMFDCDRLSCRVTQPVRSTPLWPASWLQALDKSRCSQFVEVQKVWEVHDDRLRFMSPFADERLTRSLLDGDASEWFCFGSLL